ncbi:hypothetical protein B0533_03655 [Sedimentibacter sp. SX930]|nr:hypothetical protein B0533_03655 [Sedimentibacter sp. SX930]
MELIINGVLEAEYMEDCYGNDVRYLDLYDNISNMELYDLSKYFHGKKVKIIIREIEKDEC